MIESSNFREINEIEKEIILQSLSKISPNLSQFIIRSKNMLYISLKESNSKTNYPIIYLSFNFLQEQIDLIELNDKIFSLGLYFGFIKKGNFHLSLEGAEYLYKRGILSDNKCIYISREGERSILYGNNILKNMISKISSNLEKGDFLLIFNEMNEILAIAQSKVENEDIKQLKSEDIIAYNLNDKGHYLREKQ
ncbi:MAG: PUA domain-containing protein [Promethearchaeota archaeon]